MKLMGDEHMGQLWNSDKSRKATVILGLVILFVLSMTVVFMSVDEMKKLTQTDCKEELTKEIEEAYESVNEYLDMRMTQTETVSDLLRRQNIVRGPLDMVMVDITAEPVEITVDSQLVFYVKDEVVTPGAITYVENNTLPTWCEQVVQQGQDGMDRKVYEVIYSEGKEVSRQLVEETLTEPTETIIERGTLENFAPNDAEVTEIITNEDGTGTLVLADGHTVTFNKTVAMKATAYTKGEPGVDGVTASGSEVRIGTVAIDRRMFPFGTKFYIVSNDGMYTYGFSVAEDVGGAIKNNRIDLYFNTLAECKAFGVRNCTVYVID